MWFGTPVFRCLIQREDCCAGHRAIQSSQSQNRPLHSLFSKHEGIQQDLQLGKTVPSRNKKRQITEISHRRLACLWENQQLPMSGSKETMGVRPLVPLDEQYIGVAGNQDWELLKLQNTQLVTHHGIQEPWTLLNSEPLGPIVQPHCQWASCQSQASSIPSQ